MSETMKRIEALEVEWRSEEVKAVAAERTAREHRNRMGAIKDEARELRATLVANAQVETMTAARQSLADAEAAKKAAETEAAKTKADADAMKAEAAQLLESLKAQKAEVEATLAKAKEAAPAG